MLGRPALVTVAIVCCAAIAALEALRQVTQSRAISPDNVNILKLARYMPTVGVIVIAFAFRAMATDVKKLTPWSNMSGRWATGNRSMLLDYTNEMEILAVFRAISRKDWAIMVSLTATFLCGALVPFTNSLVYVDLNTPHTVPTTLTQTSVFDFANNPLVSQKGNLTLPKNYTGAKPYAHVASERESGGNPPPWTTSKYAFDRFSFPTDDVSMENGTMTGTVNAVSAKLDCDQANYRLGDIFHAEIASCALPIQQRSRDGYAASWLNVTQCSSNSDDLRMTATVMWIGPDGNSSVSGVVCTPSFTQQAASVSVNITSDELVSYDLVGESKPLDIQTSLQALWLYLINPLDTQILKSYGRGTAQANHNFGPYDSSQRPVATTEGIINLVNDLEIYRLSADTFTALLPGDAIGNFTKLGHLQAEVELLATQIWVQVISMLARKTVEQSLAGEVTVIQRRILVWELGLRVLQALLALLAIVCIAFGAGLRPSTALDEDPGSLATTSIILAGSGNTFEKNMAQYATVPQARMESELRDTQFCFERHAVRGQPTDTSIALGRDDEPSSQGHNTESSRAKYQPISAEDADKHQPKDDEGWRPLPLLIVSKIALIVCMIGVMVTLAVMLWSSHRLNGIAKTTTDSSTAIPLVTSAILVLLGYACAGVDGATQVLAPFNVMRRWPNPYGLFIDFHSAGGRLSDLGSIRVNVALVASSAIILIIPVLKIVAAGLFEATSAQGMMSVNLSLDQSLMMDLKETFGSDDPSRIRRACQYAEWQTDPTFEFPTQSGVINNLVFSNITKVLSTGRNHTLPSDGSIEARVPAILVDVQCVPVASQNFKLGVKYNRDVGFVYEWQCTTPLCRNAFNESGLQERGFWAGGSGIYQGQTGFRGYGFDPVGPPYMMDYDYILYLGNYESLSHPFKNLTYVGKDLVPASEGTFNVSLPTMQGTVCYRNLSRITVDTTFTRPTKAGIGGPDTLLPWQPVSYDVGTIVHEGSYPKVQPKWLAPPILEMDQYGGTSDGILDSNTLWPSGGSSKNFFELLAHYQHGDASSLLDPHVFAQSAQHMYTLYVIQTLTELRSAALGSSSAKLNGTRQMQAQLLYPESRLKQDPTATYMLEGLLALILVFLVWIFQQFPSKAILPKPPTSIAAQFSLLADSGLISQIRDQNVDQRAQLERWNLFAALGWWQTSSSEVEGRSGWRWGIDVGPAVQLESWRVTPKGSLVQPRGPV
jgi:hypothetical protein